MGGGGGKGGGPAPPPQAPPPVPIDPQIAIDAQEKRNRESRSAGIRATLLSQNLDEEAELADPSLLGS